MCISDNGDAPLRHMAFKIYLNASDQEQIKLESLFKLSLSFQKTLQKKYIDTNATLPALGGWKTLAFALNQVVFF